ncbi:riboflavin transporter [Clostridia bacterium]|nr:riboflavin transporter [Clostridia bacterium]
MENIKPNKTKVMTITSVLAALSTVIYMLLEIPISAHLSINFADVPALVACATVSPMAGVMVELFRCFVHALLKGASTFYIGDIVNFIIGAAMVLSFSYMRRFMIKNSDKFSKNRVLPSGVAIAVGTLSAVISGIIANLIFYPIYMTLMEVKIESATVYMAYMVTVTVTNLTRSVGNFGVFALMLPAVPVLRRQLFLSGG